MFNGKNQVSIRIQSKIINPSPVVEITSEDLIKIYEYFILKSNNPSLVIQAMLINDFIDDRLINLTEHGYQLFFNTFHTKFTKCLFI